MDMRTSVKTYKILNIVLDCASILLFAYAVGVICIYLSVVENPPHASAEGMERIVKTIDTSTDLEELRLEAQRLFCMNESKNEYYENLPSPPIKRLVGGYFLIMILKLIYGRKLYQLSSEKR
jgi:hypothetical protein